LPVLSGQPLAVLLQRRRDGAARYLGLAWPERLEAVHQGAEAVEPGGDPQRLLHGLAPGVPHHALPVPCVALIPHGERPLLIDLVAPVPTRLAGDIHGVDLDAHEVTVDELAVREAVALNQLLVAVGVLAPQHLALTGEDTAPEVTHG